jgi:hypothetical protein
MASTNKMYRLAIILLLLPFSGAAAKDRGGDFAACDKGQFELARRIPDYHGEDRIRRLIEADLSRARREEAEGDADECLEAIDHATKLIAGQY